MSLLPIMTWLNIPLSPLQGHAASTDARYEQNMAGFFAAVDQVAEPVPYLTKFAGQQFVAAVPCMPGNIIDDGCRALQFAGREAVPGDLARDVVKWFTLTASR
jgi:hypothetical protein